MENAGEKTGFAEIFCCQPGKKLIGKGGKTMCLFLMTSRRGTTL